MAFTIDTEAALSAAAWHAKEADARARRARQARMAHINERRAELFWRTYERLSPVDAKW